MAPMIKLQHDEHLTERVAAARSAQRKNDLTLCKIVFFFLFLHGWSFASLALDCHVAHPHHRMPRRGCSRHINADEVLGGCAAPRLFCFLPFSANARVNSCVERLAGGMFVQRSKLFNQRKFLIGCEKFAPKRPANVIWWSKGLALINRICLIFCFYTRL